ncbi:MAG: sigma-70 family RNA polymerase sigma factor [Candidatus Margulisbacteria bacterium]|nr:sigma-70 family RNA polymerase sigma factor [Candidatus Margulisiibacteriota bacterium]
MSDEIKIVEVNPVYRATEAETRVEAIPDDKKDEFINLIKTIAAGIFSGGSLPPGMEFDDLVSYGWEGLMKAWKNFNNEKGAMFRTYATYRIRGEILDNIRKEWKTKNPGYSKKVDKEKIKERIMELAKDMADSNEETGEAVSDPDSSLYQALNSSAIIYLLSLENIENISTALQRQDVGDEIIGRIERSNERINLHDSIQKLASEEQQLLKLYYYENKNQMEIAKIMQMSKSKISRLHMKVLEKLKRNLSYKMGRKWSI